MNNKREKGPSLAATIVVSTLLLIGAAVGFARGAEAADSAAVKVTVVDTRELPAYPGKEAMMLLVEYAPGGADPVHRHDADAFVYVLEGSIVMGVEGGEEVTLHPGESFHEGPDDLHTVGRNASKDKPAKFLVVMLKDKDKPALMPVE